MCKVKIKVLISPSKLFVVKLQTCVIVSCQLFAPILSSYSGGCYKQLLECLTKLACFEVRPKPRIFRCKKLSTLVKNPMHVVDVAVLTCLEFIKAVHIISTVNSHSFHAVYFIQRNIIVF